MNFSETLPVITKVLTNPYVIITAIGVILLMNFACYVANYTKKPPKPKVKKEKPAPAPVPAAEKPAEGESSEEKKDAAPETSK